MVTVCCAPGLQQGSLQWQQLSALNQVATTKCADMAATAGALAAFSNQVLGIGSWRLERPIHGPAFHTAAACITATMYAVQIRSLIDYALVLLRGGDGFACGGLNAVAAVTMQYVHMWKGAADTTCSSSCNHFAFPTAQQHQLLNTLLLIQLVCLPLGPPLPMHSACSWVTSRPELRRLWTLSRSWRPNSSRSRKLWMPWMCSPASWPRAWGCQRQGACLGGADTLARCASL